MRKFFYELLYREVHNLYKKVDDAASTLCSLKKNINEMGEILEVEYKNKYKTKFNKGVLEFEDAYLEQDCGKNSKTDKINL